MSILGGGGGLLITLFLGRDNTVAPVRVLGPNFGTHMKVIRNHNDVKFRYRLIYFQIRSYFKNVQHIG
jgi:hypothetical protein